MGQNLLMDFRSIREYFRWRGPWIFILLAFRELFRPLVYWHVWNIYETDLRRGIPQPYSQANFDVALYTDRDDLSAIKPLLHSLGELSSAEIDARLERGDMVALARSSGQPLGYRWMGFSDAIELKYETYWIIRDGEALKYGSFVIPSFRGRGVHSLLNSALNAYAAQHGIQRTLGSVSILNPQSLSLPKRYGRAISMTVFLAKFRVPSFTLRKSFRAPLGSRFHWPGHPSPSEKSPLSRKFSAGDQGEDTAK